MQSSNYRGIKLRSHIVKLWEGVVEARLQTELTVSWLRKSTADVMSALRVLMEKYREGQRKLHCLCGSRESIL